jgi:hypothetical protein
VCVPLLVRNPATPCDRLIIRDNVPKSALSSVSIDPLFSSTCNRVAADGPVLRAR